jgi:hypothetical protein
MTATIMMATLATRNNTNAYQIDVLIINQPTRNTPVFAAVREREGRLTVLR